MSVLNKASSTNSSTLIMSYNTSTDELSSIQVLFFALATGLSAATLYYSQPMLGILGDGIGVSDRVIGWIPALTQVGYGVGILFLGPLGDRYDRRKVIAAKSVLLILSLFAAALTPSIEVLLIANFAIGLGATLSQDIIPTVVQLAPSSQRGKVVGVIMTGLFLGSVLSRIVSGYIAEQFGWRAVFYAAAASIILIGLQAWRTLPGLKSSTTDSYVKLMHSLLKLWRAHSALRRATFAQSLLMMGFGAFWSTLAVMLYSEPFHLGSTVAGAFGLTGAVGALAAPVIGRISDRHGPEIVTRLGAGLVVVSFAFMFFLPLLSVQARLYSLIPCAIGFNLGAQATMIAHQTIIYSIDESARSRITAVMFVGMAAGMAIGSALGSMLLVEWGWGAITILGTVTGLGALVVRIWPRKPILIGRYCS